MVGTEKIDAAIAAIVAAAGANETAAANAASEHALLAQLAAEQSKLSDEQNALERQLAQSGYDPSTQTEDADEMKGAMRRLGDLDAKKTDVARRQRIAKHRADEALALQRQADDNLTTASKALAEAWTQFGRDNIRALREEYLEAARCLRRITAEWMAVCSACNIVLQAMQSPHAEIDLSDPESPTGLAMLRTPFFHSSADKYWQQQAAGPFRDKLAALRARVQEHIR
jgi:hypothetical protein